MQTDVCGVANDVELNAGGRRWRRGTDWGASMAVAAEEGRASDVLAMASNNGVAGPGARNTAWLRSDDACGVLTFTARVSTFDCRAIVTKRNKNKIKIFTKF